MMSQLLKDRARRAVKLTLKHGQLMRPECCSRCGKSGRTKDGECACWGIRRFRHGGNRRALWGPPSLQLSLP